MKQSNVKYSDMFGIVITSQSERCSLEFLTVGDNWPGPITWLQENSGQASRSISDCLDVHPDNTAY